VTAAAATVGNLSPKTKLHPHLPVPFTDTAIFTTLSSLPPFTAETPIAD